MSSASEILIAIESMLKQLSRSLSKEDMNGGWTEEKKEKYKRFFNKVKKDIEEGKISEYKARSGSIVRTLDSSGILRGPLLEEASRISILIGR